MSVPTPEATAAVVDPFGRDVARSATGLLAELNHPEGLAAADVQVARRLGALTGCVDEPVIVAAALAVRAVRQGSVCLDLGSRPLAELLGDHAWPVPHWREALLASPLVRAADADGVTPLVLDGDLLYLDRYWSEEGLLVRDLQDRVTSAPSPPAGLDAALDRYFPPVGDGDEAGDPDQRAAVEAAVRGWTAVVTGGPGTGKTTTIARLLGVLLDGEPDLRIALAAPTGRAAARLGEAVGEATARDGFPPGPAVERIAAVPTSTLHRLLGWLPGRNTFRHDRSNRLPYDVVVVDETSMVSLTLMARLLDAMRPQARLVLVGDADQLASVDAGAVLRDVVDGLRAPDGPVRTLTRTWRFGTRISALAHAIREGRSDDAVDLLTTPGDDEGDVIELVTVDALEPLLLRQAIALREAAVADEPGAALATLEQHRLLCAHREGMAGAGYWNRRVERRLAEVAGARLGEWYVGRPILVTENDYGLGLYNGDLGVVVPGTEGLTALVADGGQGRRLAVARLSQVRSAHAMTVHRSQGSQVDDVTVLLPEVGSRLLTRQLLYTAVTRARTRVRVVGDVAAVAAAIDENVPRASGLAKRLRPDVSRESPRHG